MFQSEHDKNKKRCIQQLVGVTKQRTKRRKTKRRKIRQSREQHRRIRHGKKILKDEFNDPLTEQDFLKLVPYVQENDTCPQDTYSELRKRFQKEIEVLMQQENIPGSEKQKRDSPDAKRRTPDPSGATTLSEQDNYRQSLFHVFNFLEACRVCSTWLTRTLLTIGWTENTTGYNPISVSHSTTELSEATVECVLIALKQMRLFCTYKQKKNKETRVPPNS